jgi:hypothetical protein
MSLCEFCTIHLKFGVLDKVHLLRSLCVQVRSFMWESEWLIAMLFTSNVKGETYVSVGRQLCMFKFVLEESS